MKARAQGAFEYILLLGGVLMIVAIAFIILRSTVLPSGKQQIEANVQAINRLTCLPTYLSTPPAHWWKFDEGSGTTARDSTGGSDGTLTSHGGPVPTWTSGISGKGVHIDYGAGANDWASIDVPKSEALYFEGTSFSIELWVRPLANPSGGGIFIGYSDSYGIGTVDGNPAAFVRCVTGNCQMGNWMQGSLDIASNAWNHVAMTYDQDAETVSLYLNGNLDTTNTYPGTDYVPTYDDPNPLLVTIAATYKIGDDDQVVFYSRARSPEEIRRDAECVHNAA